MAARLLVIGVLFFGTLAPAAAAAGAKDGCESGAAELPVGSEQEPCPDEPAGGDCRDCNPDCLCFCCAIRSGVAFSFVFAPVVLNAVGIGVLSPSQPSSLLSVSDIFHPPRG